jgi:MYXO-CTERM domain-containing protein
VDSTSDATLLRFSNYNTVDSAIPASEALGAGQALVASYLHSSKPRWFGNLPWPWVDPNNYAQSNNVQNLPAGYRAVNGVDPAASTLDAGVGVPDAGSQGGADAGTLSGKGRGCGCDSPAGSNPLVWGLPLFFAILLGVRRRRSLRGR